MTERGAESNAGVVQKARAVADSLVPVGILAGFLCINLAVFFVLQAIASAVSFLTGFEGASLAAFMALAMLYVPLLVWVTAAIESGGAQHGE